MRGVSEDSQSFAGEEEELIDISNRLTPMHVIDKLIASGLGEIRQDHITPEQFRAAMRGERVMKRQVEEIIPEPVKKYRAPEKWDPAKLSKETRRKKAARAQRFRNAFDLSKLKPEDHGKVSTYNNCGCRCELCTDVRRQYHLSWRTMQRENRRESQGRNTGNRWVPLQFGKAGA